MIVTGIIYNQRFKKLPGPIIYNKGKTCKTPHIEESYFVMSHEYSPILY
jgi:hypothetical protein